MGDKTDDGGGMATLTDRAIQGAKADEKDLWLSDGGARGAGRLYLRVQRSGRKGFYFRCSGPDGERQTIALGDYHQKGGGAGLTLTMARERAGDLERLYRDGHKDIRGYLERERKAAERAHIEAEESARRAAEEATRGSLRNLLSGYTDHLERAGKIDAGDVRGIFRLHVFAPWGDLCERKANEIRTADLRQVLARLIDQKKGRTAGKLRSYIRAAYAAAIRAENDPTAPATLLGYGIEYNPADALPALSHLSVPGDRTLTDDELRCYLNGIEDLPLVTRAALRVAIYLGGQRPTQLLRAAPGDVELIGDDDGEIRIYDRKGARKVARVHVLPLHGQARAEVAMLLDINKRSSFLFSNTAGTHLRAETAAAAVFEISTAMVESGRSVVGFQQKDIRRTCETMLARMGVSKDLRAQLLSHGLGGVQQRHYDRHEYLAEKRAALIAWAKKLDAIKAGTDNGGNVVEIRRGAA